MTIHLLLNGLAIGFCIAAPVGPIGVLCIRRSLAYGRTVGLVTGLGAATADTLCGCVAAFGLTAVSGFLVSQRFWIGLFGGFFLCVIGVRTYTSKPSEKTEAVETHGLFSAYFSTLVLTLANPVTILSFMAVFAGLGIGVSSDFLSASLLVFGVFVGSTFWWLMLSSGISLFQTKVGPGFLQKINHITGVIIFIFGIYALTSLFFK